LIAVEKILRKLIQLDEYLSVLSEIAERSSDSFIQDRILVGSAKYYLQISIETCLDITNHIIAASGYRAPKDYADAFSVLEENNILQKVFAQKLRQMAKFRNRLVHLYGEIDNVFVYSFMKNDIVDIREFQRIIKNRILKS